VCNYCGLQALFFTVQCGIYNTTVRPRHASALTICSCRFLT
jgi:hypothetical protein